jgi:hypothetical protein
MPGLTLPKPGIDEIEAEFLPTFQTAYKTAPFLGSIDAWAKLNVELPAGYNPPGKFDVKASPYFVEPFTPAFVKSTTAGGPTISPGEREDRLARLG